MEAEMALPVLEGQEPNSAIVVVAKVLTKECPCHGNLETVAMGWLNEGARRCATMGLARDCANRDTSIYPGSGPSTPEVKPLLPACFVLSRQWLQRSSSCSV
jgi:hypothetical protein